MSSILEKKIAVNSTQFIRLGLLIVVLTLCIWLGKQALQNEAFRETIVTYGYPGLFVLAFISGFNVFVPVPSITFLPVFVASGLEFTSVIAVIVVGTTCADLVAFQL